MRRWSTSTSLRSDRYRTESLSIAYQVIEVVRSSVRYLENAEAVSTDRYWPIALSPTPWKLGHGW
jgi:hypothetical protein